MNHPALRGILLDAPFDDLTLLVTRHGHGIWVAFFQECQQGSCGQAERIAPSLLPPSLLPFAVPTLRRHYNLDNVAQLSHCAHTPPLRPSRDLSATHHGMFSR